MATETNERPTETNELSTETNQRPTETNERPTETKKGLNVVPIEQEAFQDVHYVALGWRSWIAVFVTSFACMAQIYTVLAAGSVISFIVRDLGEAQKGGWIVQAPLLMQTVLSAIVGRLSDVLDRKYLASIPPLIAFVGAIVSAKAENMNQLIGGGILIGVTLSTIAIVHAIPSEVLPLKYRVVANGLGYIGGVVGGFVGNLAAGALTNTGQHGWRYIFWLQAAFHGITGLGLLLFYQPPKNKNRPKLSIKEVLWACDPVGSLLLASGCVLVLLALDWAGAGQGWSHARVVAPLTIGLFVLLLFVAYEWKGRDDGLVAHIFFRKNANFIISLFIFAVEGCLFLVVVNAIIPMMILNLGFEADSWHIAMRGLVYGISTLIASALIIWYATRSKDMKWPLVGCFVVFLGVLCSYAAIQPTASWSRAQFALGALAGIGQAGPLTLIVAWTQFSSPHAYLSTATGLAYSARAIGGAFGSAILTAIISGYLYNHLEGPVVEAAVGAGLPRQGLSALIGALRSGRVVPIEGATPAVWQAARSASAKVHAVAYRLAFSSVIPFVVLAILATLFLKQVDALFTDKVEAPVEKVQMTDQGGADTRNGDAAV